MLISAQRSLNVLKLLIIRDSRPGHFNQSEGVAKAIQRLTPVSIQYLDVGDHSFPSRRLLYFLFNRTWSLSDLLLGSAFRNIASQDAPDLIISAGGDTLLLNVSLARHWGCDNIFSGSIRNLKPKFFSTILSQYHRFNEVKPYIVTIKPSPIDPDCSVSEERKTEFCFLIGGPSGTHSYSKQEWDYLTELVAQCARQSRLSVVTSRRTPQALTLRLNDIARGAPNLIFVDFEEAGAGASFAHCMRANTILVTEDSNSMISEAVCCRRPVIALAPANTRMPSDESAYLTYLESKGWLKRTALDGTLSLNSIRDDCARLSPMTFNHLHILAEKLKQSVPCLRTLAF